MNFKLEVCQLAFAITLFMVSAFFFSYQSGSASYLTLASYPYRGIALSFVGFGSLLMVTASLSFTKRSKTSFR
jgi:hypothetical protein